jgi:predicted Rossmann fold nucleotide-binding protein DprA/Smf involved in DNA uptake
VRIGFTGTRRGMNEIQTTNLDKLLHQHKFSSRWFIHGGAVGADTQAHNIAKRFGYKIKIFPCHSTSLSLFADEMAPVMPPLSRNRLLVLDCDLLVATPFEDEEVLRSGTWATIRFARRVKRKIILLFPSGMMQVGDVMLSGWED